MMEKIGQTLAKQLRQSHTDLNELTQVILADKEIADFITSNGLTQKQINRSLPKFNQFMVERENFKIRINPILLKVTSLLLA